MHVDDKLQKYAAVSRRDSHYSSQRTVLSYSTSQSCRRSLSIENNNHANFNTRSARSSRPDSIRYLDSEAFTLTDEYSFIDGCGDTRGIRPLSNGSLSYIDYNLTRTKSSGHTTTFPLVEDKNYVSNFSRKESLASLASKKSGKNYGHDNSSTIKTRYNNGLDNQISSPRDPPEAGYSAYENAVSGGGGGAGSSGNGFEASAGQRPGVPGGSAKTMTDLLPDHVDHGLSYHGLYQKRPSNLALDDSKFPVHHVDSLEQGRKSNAEVRATVISPAIHLNDWSQIPNGAPMSRSGKDDGSKDYDHDVEEFRDDVHVYSAQQCGMSMRSNLAQWKVMDKFALLGYLTIFSMFGTLARIGLEKLTFYPGAPVSTSVLWANFTGCFIIGFLSGEVQLVEYNSSLAQRQHPRLNRYGPSEKVVRKSANATKSTSSLYVGLTTGFCGSLTSFSALMHDAFLSISNDLPGLGSDTAIFDNDEIRAVSGGGLSRSAFYSILAVLATLIINAALSIGAFVGGQHLASGLGSALPMLPRIITGTSNTSTSGKGNTINIAIILIGVLLWSTIIVFAVLSTTLNISSSTCITFVFPLAFAPPGCLLRYSLSTLNKPFQRRNCKSLHKGSNAIKQTTLFRGPPRPRTLWQRFSSSALLSAVSLGTLIANLLGSLIFSLSWDFQHGLGFGRGTDPVSPLLCHILAGIQDGFCGALTTVSTLVQEIVGMTDAPRWKQRQQSGPDMQQQQNGRKKESRQEQGERWWVPHREQRQKQRRRQELERTEQRIIRRRRSLESAPTERDLSRLDLRESMKPRARFIASARSDYRDDNDEFNNNGYGDEWHQLERGMGRNKNNNNNPFRNDGIVTVVDNDDDDDDDDYAKCAGAGAGITYRYGHGHSDYDYKRAYAYGIGTLLAGLVVVLAVMGPVKWGDDNWVPGVESERFCFSSLG